MGSGAAGRLVVPAGRAEDDAARTGRDGDALTLGVFLNGAEIRDADTQQGEPVIDDSFLILFNADHERDRRSRCRPRASAAAGTLELSTAEPERRAGSRRHRRARASSRSRARSLRRAPPSRLMARAARAPTGSSSGRGSASREARGLVPYLRELGVSHLYLSPSLQARPGSTHGYDVVDPTRDLGGARRRGRVPRALRGRARAWCSTSSRTTWRRATRTPSGATRCWRAKFFDLDWHTGAHRRFFDVGELAGVRIEDPEVFETTHAQGARARRARGWSTALRDRPSRRARRTRAATSSGCARRASSTSGSRRSSSRASGCATGRSRARRLRVPERRRRRSSSTRPARSR